MNNLKRCTFTGIDEQVNLSQLKDVSKQYPFIEWGILFSTAEKAAFSRNRYPNFDWFSKNIETLKSMADETGVGLSLHVCGKETKNLLEMQPSFLLDILPYFNRVQINFRYKEHNIQEIDNLLKQYPNILFITQHNKVNQDLYQKINNANHQVLFDLSGGRGIVAEEWIKPLENKVCGYAGGLGPENIMIELEKIAQVVQNHNFWIDMEGKVRTDDNLDLLKCMFVAEQVQKQFHYHIK